jgi:glyoxylase-like metal-dependent hydrolase (beta-lactamase superfamily II)
MREILPGLFQLRVPIPNNTVLGNTNSYLLRGDGEALLIDPGMNNAESLKALKNELKESGVNIRSITRIIATHGHPDHYGLSGKVKKLSTNAQIIVHKGAGDGIKRMAKPGRGRGGRMEEWLRINGVPESSPDDSQKGPPQGSETKRPAGKPRFTRPLLPDVLLEGDEIITIGDFNLRVIFTPGHDMGHICLYEAGNKLLFSGDHVLPVINTSVGLQTDPAVNPLGDFLNSINAIKALDVDLVLPAHEQPFTNFRNRVDEIIAHHHRRNEDIISALKEKPKNAYEIAQEIIWMPQQGGTKFKDLRQWDQRMAVLDTLAHLKVMKENGKVEIFSNNPIIYYNVTVN